MHYPPDGPTHFYGTGTADPLRSDITLRSLWVALAIVAGIVLGNLAPAAFALLAKIEVASVNLVVAVLIWAMIFPMMVAIDLASIRDSGRKPRGLPL